MMKKIPTSNRDIFFKEDTPYTRNYGHDYIEAEYELSWYHETEVSAKDLEVIQNNGWKLKTIDKLAEDHYKITI